MTVGAAAVRILLVQPAVRSQHNSGYKHKVCFILLSPGGVAAGWQSGGVV